LQGDRLDGLGVGRRYGVLRERLVHRFQLLDLSAARGSTLPG
jgi:hypothetical protein